MGDDELYYSFTGKNSELHNPKEEAMDMEDDDMEIENRVFVAHEIDLDYEFDAARFFDFCVEETSSQARQAELCFCGKASAERGEC
ncbi:unnamed protein product [Lupinus luteus]|uniref:Uncharacterized protein n=1 Tax=Lupinus luteus TaxID=3873 RepID=A0AAV1YFH1_LUPLU